MTTSSVSGRHIQFKEVIENVEDEERIGGPKSHRTDEKVEKVWNMVKCLSLRTMDVQINFTKKELHA
jgi:hypothetical protein